MANQLRGRQGRNLNTCELQTNRPGTRLGEEFYG